MLPRQFFSHFRHFTSSSGASAASAAPRAQGWDWEAGRAGKHKEGVHDPVKIAGRPREGAGLRGKAAAGVQLPQHRVLAGKTLLPNANRWWRSHRKWVAKKTATAAGASERESVPLSPLLDVNLHECLIRTECCFGAYRLPPPPPFPAVTLTLRRLRHPPPPPGQRDRLAAGTGTARGRRWAPLGTATACRAASQAAKPSAVRLSLARHQCSHRDNPSYLLGKHLGQAFFRDGRAAGRAAGRVGGWRNGCDATAFSRKIQRDTHAGRRYAMGGGGGGARISCWQHVWEEGRGGVADVGASP